MNEEPLGIFLAEVKAIVNSRPLIRETNNDVIRKAELLSTHILTMRLKVVILPPGVFEKSDLNCSLRWRRFLIYKQWVSQLSKIRPISVHQEKQKWTATQTKYTYCKHNNSKGSLQ